MPNDCLDWSEKGDWVSKLVNVFILVSAVSTIVAVRNWDKWVSSSGEIVIKIDGALEDAIGRDVFPEAFLKDVFGTVSINGRDDTNVIELSLGEEGILATYNGGQKELFPFPETLEPKS